MTPRPGAARRDRVRERDRASLMPFCASAFAGVLYNNPWYNRSMYSRISYEPD